MLAIGIVHGLVVNHDGLNCLNMQYIDIVSYAVRVNRKIVHVKKSVIGVHLNGMIKMKSCS